MFCHFSRTVPPNEKRALLFGEDDRLKVASFLNQRLYCTLQKARRTILSQYLSGFLLATMATKMKGIYKGFKFISQIFIVKERELDIGYPTDVKHVAHIGWDGTSGSAPSWMSEYKPGADFSPVVTPSFSNPGDSNSVAHSTWSSEDFDQPMGQQGMTNMFKDVSSAEVRSNSKNPRRKKKGSTCSPRFASPKFASSSRSSRSAKPKPTFAEKEATTSTRFRETLKEY